MTRDLLCVTLGLLLGAAIVLGAGLLVGGVRYAVGCAAAGAEVCAVEIMP